MRMQDEGAFTGLGPLKLVERLSGPISPRFSLCCMVTRRDEYALCIDSLRQAGFDDRNSERLIVDNSKGNKADAYIGVNELLQAACGDYVIIHHQDILLLAGNGANELDRKLSELTLIDPKWGLCGNAGRTANGWPAICISHPFRQTDIRGGPFPTRVVSLDENFIVVRRRANLALSSDLQGFHHYGVDLCIIADILGWRSYVIDFFLRHNSGGTFDQIYEESLLAIEAKYNRALRPRWAFLINNRHFVLSASRVRRIAWRAARKLGKAAGLVPRNHQLEDADYVRNRARVPSRPRHLTRHTAHPKHPPE